MGIPTGGLSPVGILGSKGELSMSLFFESRWSMGIPTEGRRFVGKAGQGLRVPVLFEECPSTGIPEEGGGKTGMPAVLTRSLGIPGLMSPAWVCLV